MREAVEVLIAKMEQEEEFQLIRTKISEYEAKIKESVSEDTWQFFLQWESLWAEYADCAMRYIYETTMN